MPVLSKLAAGVALPLPLFERSNSCAMLSPAMTAMRSVPVIFPESRISRMRRSTNCTARSNSSRSDSRQATRYSRPRMETSRVIEGSSIDSACRFRQLLQKGVESRGGSGDARIQRSVLLQRTAELAIQRLVFGAQPMVVGQQRGEFLFESGEFGVHGARSHYRRKDSAASTATDGARGLRFQLVASGSYRTVNISSSSAPPGVFSVTTSPSRALINARAMGETQLT